MGDLALSLPPVLGLDGKPWSVGLLDLEPFSNTKLIWEGETSVFQNRSAYAEGHKLQANSLALWKDLVALRWWQ